MNTYTWLDIQNLPRLDRTALCCDLLTLLLVSVKGPLECTVGMCLF